MNILPEPVDARLSHANLSPMPEIPAMLKPVRRITDAPVGTLLIGDSRAVLENQNRTKPDETPRAGQNCPLIIRHLRKNPPDPRPVLHFENPRPGAVTQRPPNNTLTSINGNLAVTVGNLW